MSWVLDMTCVATTDLTFATHATHVAVLPFFTFPPIPLLSSNVPLLFSLLPPGTKGINGTFHGLICFFSLLCFLLGGTRSVCVHVCDCVRV